jgi:4-diphosphocytidyl-2-C-methyl-D-erythritol kinase
MRVSPGPTTRFAFLRTLRESKTQEAGRRPDQVRFVTVTSVTVRVPAKINLQLAVGLLRPDGYHGLVTVFHAVSLFDELTVAPTETDTVRVTGEGEGLVPEDGDNLALRAVRVLRKAVAARNGASGRQTAAGVNGVSGVDVTIAKRIPVAGGMAGGSADAAAALVACNELWNTGLSQAELCVLAGDVGSDVAFAVVGGTAIGEGRGEQLTPAPAAPTTYHWVIALADGHLSTPKVFHELDRQREAQGVPKFAEPALSNELMAALSAGDPVRLGAALSNDLQEPALTLFPALRKTLDAGREAGARGALISGSGPTCFFLADNAEQATKLAAALSGAGVCREVITATGPVPGATVVTDEMR